MPLFDQSETHLWLGWRMLLKNITVLPVDASRDSGLSSRKPNAAK
jgi:hypothetical protein